MTAYQTHPIFLWKNQPFDVDDLEEVNSFSDATEIILIIQLNSLFGTLIEVSDLSGVVVVAVIDADVHGLSMKSNWSSLYTDYQ